MASLFQTLRGRNSQLDVTVRLFATDKKLRDGIVELRCFFGPGCVVFGLSVARQFC
ncbi:MAG: hypothetical protein AAFV87_11945 [Pseudomonadota bacterium]